LKNNNINWKIKCNYEIQDSRGSSSNKRWKKRQKGNISKQIVNREQCGHMGGKRFSLFGWLNDQRSSKAEITSPNVTASYGIVSRLSDLVPLFLYPKQKSYHLIFSLHQSICCLGNERPTVLSSTRTSEGLEGIG
jgi:hypothetical protein